MGQSFTQDKAADGSVVLTLSGGGTITLAGVTTFSPGSWPERSESPLHRHPPPALDTAGIGRGRISIQDRPRLRPAPSSGGVDISRGAISRLRSEAEVSAAPAPRVPVEAAGAVAPCRIAWQIMR